MIMKTTSLLLAAALALTIHSAQAASGDWTGTTDGNWNVDSNWTGATYPGTALLDVATFNADVTNSTISMNGAAISPNQIVFDTSAEAYTFNAGGGSLQFANITINSSVGAVTQTFNLAVNIDSTSSVSNDSTSAILNLAGGANNIGAANRLLRFYGVGTTNLNGMSQTGGGVFTIEKRETGKLILTGTSTKTGVTQIRDGILQINSVGALGTAEVQFAGGIIGLGAENFTLGLGSGINKIRWIAQEATAAGTGFAAYGADRIVNIGNASATFNWEATSSIKDGQTLILGSADSTNKVIFQNGLGLADKARTILVNNGTSSTNVDGEISGAISSTVAASGSLVKTGAGTLLLSATNTYTGLTTVSVGTLLVGNSSGVGSLAGGATVGSGATLGGSGSIAGVTTIQSGARLAPGNSPGLLTVNNDVTIEDGGIFTVEVNGTTAGTGYDRLAMTGGGSDFSLTGSNDLEMSLGFTPAANALFFLVDNAGGSAISGIFESLNGVVTDLSQGALFSFGGQDFNISYTGDLVGNAFTGGDDLVIQAVPEPTTWVMLALGGLFLLGFRRRAHC